MSLGPSASKVRFTDNVSGTAPGLAPSVSRVGFAEGDSSAGAAATPSSPLGPSLAPSSSKVRFGDDVSSEPASSSSRVRFGENVAPPAALTAQQRLAEAVSAAAPGGPSSSGTPVDDDDLPSAKTLAKIFDATYLETTAKELARQYGRRKKGDFMVAYIRDFSVLAFLLCVVMLGVYSYLGPKSPSFEIVAAGFDFLEVVPVSNAEIALQQASGEGNYFAAYFNFSATFTVLYKNKNKRVDIFNEFLELTSYYNGFKLGSGRTGPFDQHRQSSQIYRVRIGESHLPVPLNVYYTMWNDVNLGKSDFIITLNVKAKMSTVGSIKSPVFFLKVRCEVTLKDFKLAYTLCKFQN